ncbi:MAG TPA: hypothetical protein DCY13_23020 [Verrucomicrobiales bacterium]|nr:hypothetical protein [Verrucomicrobiales bacterium]
MTLLPLRLAGLAVVAMGLAVGPVLGEPLRLVSWNAESLAKVADRASTMEARVNSAALHLQAQRPDILFLQGVPDRATAQKLAVRMGNGFKVVVCSSLTRKESGEVAILSALESGLSWPDQWSPVAGDDGSVTAGGHAFATLRSGDLWLAVYSIEFPDSVAARTQREEAMRELLKHVAAVGEWRTNRPTAFLFGGTLNIDPEEAARTGETTLKLARDAGFTSGFLSLERTERLTLRSRAQYPASTADYLFADWGGFLAPAETFPGIISDHAMVVAVWDPEGTMPVVPVLATAVGTVPNLAANELLGVDLKWWVAGLGCFVALMFLVLLFRRPQPVFDPSRALPSSQGNNILFLSDSEKRAEAAQGGMSESERRKLRPHLLGWLKERFIGTLVSQRRELLDTQQQASEQAAELGRRVEKIQEQLFNRIQKAEQRVIELEKELALAKSENRELIQSNLLLAQRELDEARRKLEAAGR